MANAHLRFIAAVFRDSNDRSAEGISTIFRIQGCSDRPVFEEFKNRSILWDPIRIGCRVFLQLSRTVKWTPVIPSNNRIERHAYPLPNDVSYVTRMWEPSYQRIRDHSSNLWRTRTIAQCPPAERNSSASCVREVCNSWEATTPRQPFNVRAPNALCIATAV